ncbi:MAG: ABC transporter permease subunit [Pseudomonadota bacterium]
MTSASDAIASAKANGRLAPEVVVWAIAAVIVIASVSRRDTLSWMTDYPAAWTLPVADWINLLMDWLVERSRWFFRGIAWLFGWPMTWIQNLLHWLPWPATIAIFAGLARFVGGWRLAGFTVAALLYMVTFGYWSQSMNTLVLVFMAIPLAGGVGLFLGIWAFRSPRVEAVMKPALDAMQTVPMFAYLIPILVLFGFGPTVAIIATAIYACPPMVRNVILGLRQVPTEVVESGVMSGTNRRQLMWMVQLPSALPAVLMGVNQVVMQSLNMIIIAAVIGSTHDIGWEVLYGLRKAWFGQSLMSGVVVVLLAIVLDRITRGFATREPQPVGGEISVLQRYWPLWSALAVALSFIAVAAFVPFLKTYPEAWYLRPASAINEALASVTGSSAELMESVKRLVLFFFLFPLKIGLESTIRPFTWGFELTPIITSAYVVSIAAAALGLVWLRRWRAATTVVVLGSLLFFGIVKLPWPAFIVIIAALAYSIGGLRAGAMTLLGLAYLLIAGIWTPAINSIYLCAAAVVMSFFLGGLLGVWAALNDTVSKVIRPVVDTLQTMPLFVFLIPVLMFFQVGEFPAFLAITAYAIVPSIRYTEHGLRNVSADYIEVARSTGCTKSQVFWQVTLPLAMPAVMLGLNQTIMFALQMLSISALVGSTELGQEIYIGLSNADTGQGLVAALGIVVIAMISDRIIQMWSAKRKAALGIS